MCSCGETYFLRASFCSPLCRLCGRCSEFIFCFLLHTTNRSSLLSFEPIIQGKRPEVDAKAVRVGSGLSRDFLNIDIFIKPALRLKQRQAVPAHAFPVRVSLQWCLRTTSH